MSDKICTTDNDYSQNKSDIHRARRSLIKLVRAIAKQAAKADYSHELRLRGERNV